MQRAQAVQKPGHDTGRTPAQCRREEATNGALEQTNRLIGIARGQPQENERDSECECPQIRRAPHDRGRRALAQRKPRKRDRYEQEEGQHQSVEDALGDERRDGSPYVETFGTGQRVRAGKLTQACWKQIVDREPDARCAESRVEPRIRMHRLEKNAPTQRA